MYVLLVSCGVRFLPAELKFKIRGTLDKAKQQ